jgi:hypothetical protein
MKYTQMHSTSDTNVSVCLPQSSLAAALGVKSQPSARSPPAENSSRNDFVVGRPKTLLNPATLRRKIPTAVPAWL